MNPQFIKKNDNTVTFQDKKDEILSQIDKYDATMLSYLARLYEAMNGEKMDFTKIQNAVDALAAFNKRAEYNYLNNLLYPEKCKGVKIPSPIPVPSCSFQLHNCVTLSTNSSGNLAFIFNPFFLANNNDFNKAVPINREGNYELTQTEFLSTLWVNNDNSLDGHSANTNFFPVNIGQAIPNVYDQYRLVSASIVIKYIGRLDITSGVIGGAIIYDDNKTVGCRATFTNLDSQSSDILITTNQDLAKYGNFDLAMDSFYHQENLCLEGMRELYFPLDNSYEEYTKLCGNTQMEVAKVGNFYEIRYTDSDIYKSGFNYFIYVLGAPPTSSCFKVDIYCNYECLPNASFLNYLPLSMNADTISNAEKKSIIATVQQKPVMSIKETQALVVPAKPSIWEKLKNKFKDALPGIGKLIKWGITSMIPGLKPGLALAGTMLNAISGGEQQQPQGGAPMYEEVE